MTDNSTITLKICLIGDYGVGKTSLRRHFIGKRVKRKYLPTVGADFSFKEVKFDDQKYHLLLWDIAGEEKFRNVRGLYFQGVFGCILVFDLTRRDSFDNLHNWIDDIESSTLTEGVPIWVLANKSDLLLIEESTINDTEINDWIESLNQRYNNRFSVNWSKTSAISGVNVRESFEGLVHNIMDWLPRRKEQ